MNRFGELLRYYRAQSRDPLRGRALSQERLGEWLGEVLGDAGYTGAAVSAWERGHSRISHDQRRVLVALIQVLYLGGSLKTAIEADTFLLAGEYRGLNDEERGRISEAWVTGPAEDRPHLAEGWGWSVALYLAEVAARPLVLLSELRSAPAAADPPDWAGVALLALGKMVRGAHRRRWAWVAIWWAAWLWVFPTLRLPAPDPATFQQTLILYAGAASVLPALIALLTPTSAESLWDGATVTARVYTYQGAYIGFHLAYMALFSGALLGHYLDLEPWPRTLQWLLAAAPMGLSYAAARQLPFNYWRAFGTLQITRRDRLPILAFAVFAPAWAWFLAALGGWLLDRWLGPGLLLTAIGLAWLIRERPWPFTSETP